MVDEKIENPKHNSVIEKSRSFIEWAVFVVTLCTLVIVYLEYRSAQREQLIEKTFSLVDDWDKLDYYDDYANYAEVLLRLHQEASVESSEKFSSGVSTAAKNYIQKGLLKSSPDEVKSIERIYYYFSKLSICVKENVCSRSLVESFFGERMRNFRRWTDLYAKQRRESASNFTSDIDEFLDEKQ